eukprot:1625640-Prymnesium_polylepis.1
MPSAPTTRSSRSRLAVPSRARPTSLRMPSNRASSAPRPPESPAMPRAALGVLSLLRDHRGGVTRCTRSVIRMRRVGKKGRDASARLSPSKPQAARTPLSFLTFGACARS